MPVAPDGTIRVKFTFDGEVTRQRVHTRYLTEGKLQDLVAKIFNLSGKKISIYRLSKSAGTWTPLSDRHSYVILTRSLTVKKSISLLILLDDDEPQRKKMANNQPKEKSAFTLDVPAAPVSSPVESLGSVSGVNLRLPSNSTTTLLPTYSASQSAKSQEPAPSQRTNLEAPNPNMNSRETLPTEASADQNFTNQNFPTKESTCETEFNINNLLKNFPEEFLQNLSNILGKQNEFINTVGDYIANKTTPVLVTLVEQLVAEIQSQVASKRSNIHEKINSKLPEAFDSIISDLKNNAVDLRQMKLLRTFLEKLEVVKKANVEVNSFLNDISVSLDNVHEALRQSIDEFVSQNLNQGSAKSFETKGSFPEAQNYYSGRQNTRVKNFNRNVEPFKPEQHPLYCIGYICDRCNKTINGYRFMSLIEDGYDLCPSCYTTELQSKDDGFESTYKLVKFVTGASCKRNLYTTTAEHNRNILTICDFCEKTITSEDHFKCLNCPNFDLCSMCIPFQKEIHDGHDFVHILDQKVLISYSHLSSKPVHIGFSCDGPLCSQTTQCIRGIRYKCAVCHDFDLCEDCEANPVTGHDPSHIMLKIREPRKFSLTTFEDDTMVNACPARVGISVSNITRDIPVPETNSGPDLVHSSLENSFSGQVTSVAEPESKVSGSSLSQTGFTIFQSSPMQVSPSPDRLSPVSVSSRNHTVIQTEESIQPQPLSTDDVAVLSQSDKTTIYAITVVNTTSRNWATGARLVSKNSGESSKVIFEIAPNQSYTFVLPVYTGVTVNDLSADSWSVQFESFEYPLEIKVNSGNSDDHSESKERLAKSLSSSDVVLPKLPIESEASLSISASNSSLRTFTPSFTSSAINTFMDIQNESSAGERAVDEASESEADSDGSLLIVSRTASPSIMAASFSGIDTDDDDRIIDEDDMFTESEYAFV